MIRLEPYAPRPIRSLGIWEPAGWRFKLYGIRYGGERPDATLVEAAKATAIDRIPRIDAERGPYGVGFLGVHQGRGANFAFLDWWGNENELFHNVWVSTPEKPRAFKPATAQHSSVCVWDLRVQAHEREAWLKHVLRNARGPDLEAYARDALNEDA